MRQDETAWRLGVSPAYVLVLVAALIACDRSKPAAPTASRAVQPLRRTAEPERVVAIGDLHGDLTSTRAALRLAGAIDAQDRWVGGKLVVVQTGDQLDRGDDEPDILALLERLRIEAKAAGGDVVVLNGNHELMNVAGDFRYVTADGFADYAADRGLHASQADPASHAGRARAFAPGGSAAQTLAQRPVTAQIGATLFAHGGVLAKHVEYGLSRINREVGEWIAGSRPAPPPIMAGADSPVWSRVYSHGEPSPAACAELTKTLERTGAKRLVVGHTIQPQGITHACSGRVWRIDVGLARLYGGPIEVLEISGDQVRALKQP